MNRVFGVYGASGFGREVMPLARAQVLAEYGRSERVVFVDDGRAGGGANGHEILSWHDFIAADSAERRICIAIAWPDVRRRIALQCEEAGVDFFSVRASNVVEMDGVSIGDGGILSPFVTLTSNLEIGRHFHANIYSYVAHDCVIGDFVTFAPGVHCNGNVHIGDGAYIGTGAIIRQGTPDKPLTIGAGAVVGMGAVVTKDVPTGVTVVGNPARPLVKT